MPLAISSECPGCQRFDRTGDFFHEKDEWEKYHKSGWTNGISDWQPREEMQDTLNRMKKVWLEVQEMRVNSREEYIKEHGHLPGEVPDWKLKKILSKR